MMFKNRTEIALFLAYVVLVTVVGLALYALGFVLALIWPLILLVLTVAKLERK